MRIASPQSFFPQYPAVAASATLVFALSACQSAPLVGTADAPTVSAAPSKTAVVTSERASAPAADTSADAASPINQRSREREAAWTDAIRGLEFETGVVVVDPVFVTNDPAQMTRFMREGIDAAETNLKTEAVQAYARAVLAAPHRSEPYMGLGEAMIMKGKIDLAIATYRTVVKMDPAHVEARIGLSESLARVQRRDEAIEEMNAAIALDPEHGPAHVRLAIWNYYQGDYAIAWEHVHAAQTLDGPLPAQFIGLLESKMADPG